jgi:hypothetical protein
MSVDLIVSLVTWLLIAGFIYWAAQKLVAIAPIDEWFKQIINVLLLIAVGFIVLFKVIIPVLQAVAHISINIH